MRNPLHLGDVIKGYAGGLFGVDGYGDKVVEGVGRDWVVVRVIPDTGGNNDEMVYLLSGDDLRAVMRYVYGPPEVKA